LTLQENLLLQNMRSIIQPQHHKLSQSLNRNTSSKEKQLISTSPSVICTTLPLLRRMWDALEEWRSSWKIRSSMKSPNEWQLDSCIAWHHKSNIVCIPTLSQRGDYTYGLWILCQTHQCPLQAYCLFPPPHLLSFVANHMVDKNTTVTTYLNNCP